jgi:hypothetical protein
MTLFGVSLRLKTRRRSERAETPLFLSFVTFYKNIMVQL